MTAGQMYQAWGLQVRSFVKLPLPESPATMADVEVRAGTVTPPRPIPMPAAFLVDGESIYLERTGLGRLRISEGRQIVADVHAGYTDSQVASVVVGPGLGVIMFQRDHLVLHACALAFGTRTVAFLGGSGAGKSTLAAALLEAGGAFVTDDVLALRISPSGIHAVPGAPVQKLWPDSARIAGLDPEGMPRVSPETEKRIRLVDAGEEGPLSAIYVLEWGDEERIEALTASAALPELVRHSYCGVLLGPTTFAAHFNQCVAVARGVPVARLVRRPEAASNRAAVEMVLSQL